MLKETILSCLKDKDMGTLKVLLASAESMEIHHAFNGLSPGEQVIAFRLLSKNDALALFELLDTGAQQNLLRSFTDERAREFVNKLAPDDRVKLLDELPALVAKELIHSLSPQEREVTNIIMGYAPETAGHIMTTECISLRGYMTAEEALAKVRRQAREKETIYTLFVTDDTKKLEGVLTLQELLMTDGAARIKDVMSKKAIRVYTDTDQEKVARTLQELDLLAIPVVDKEERLVGIVTIDDAVDILEEEATEDIYDQAGLADVTADETSRSEVLVHGSLWKIWKVRLPILLITLGVGIVSGLVIGGFEQTLESMAMVAVFIPVIMGMGGNVGTQSSTVFVRGVALGQIKMKNFMKHFVKEVLVGFSISAVIGLCMGVLAALFGHVWHDLPLLGLAVGMALVITITVAAVLGFLVPFVLIKLNVDQAAGSAPIITSLKDVVALVIYFVCVNVFLGSMGG